MIKIAREISLELPHWVTVYNADRVGRVVRVEVIVESQVSQVPTWVVDEEKDS